MKTTERWAMRGTWTGLCLGVLLAAGCSEGEGSLADRLSDGETPTNGMTPPASEEPPSGETPAPVGGSPSSDVDLDGVQGPVDTTPHSIAADDARIQYTGRVDFSDPKAPKFSSPGVTIRARFRGDSISVLLKDEIKWGTNRSIFDVVIDGTVTGKLEANRDQTQMRYDVATGLAPGQHELVLAKRTESGMGQATFMGFEVGGDLVEPPARPALKIEFIGDSITAGAGADATGTAVPVCSMDGFGNTGGWGQQASEAYLSYGSVAARAVGAEFALTAVSGIGLVRNYDMSAGQVAMPGVYGRLFLEVPTSPAWDRSRFVPDVVVVALGTNDFSPGNNPPDNPRVPMDVATYTDAYVGFVSTLRGYYPDAQIFAVSSPMLGDGWPQPQNTFKTDLITVVGAVAQHFNDAGDTKVHSYVTTSLSGQGCGTHPNVTQHAQLGQELATQIKSVMGL